MSPGRDDRTPGDDRYDNAEYDEDSPRSILSTTWFRAIVVIVVLAVAGILALPYVLDWVGPSGLSPIVKGPAVTAPSPPLDAAAPKAPPSSAPPPAASQAPSTSPRPEKALAQKAEAPRPQAAGTPRAKEATRAAAETTATSERPKSPKAAATTARPKAPRKASAAAGGQYWVQVGAFKDEARAKALVAKLRAEDFPAEEVAEALGGAGEGSIPEPPVSIGDKYDVFVSGASSADVNAKLSGEGLSAEPVAGGAVIKPSLPLRDAVTLSKDLATGGLKVQVRRASGAAGGAPAAARPTVSAGDGLYRVRVGAFPDRARAEEAKKSLAARGYSGFIARSGG